MLHTYKIYKKILLIPFHAITMINVLPIPFISADITIGGSFNIFKQTRDAVILTKSLRNARFVL